MNSKIEHSKSAASGGDMVKYVGAALLVLAGLFVWFWFSTPVRAAQLGAWSGQLRALAVVVGLAAGGALFMFTAKGHQVREFLSESRFELRKVVWPTGQETGQTTLVVVVAVLVMGVFFWLLDMLLGAVTQALTGQGG